MTTTTTHTTTVYGPPAPGVFGPMDLWIAEHDRIQEDRRQAEREQHREHLADVRRRARALNLLVRWHAGNYAAEGLYAVGEVDGGPGSVWRSLYNVRLDVVEAALAELEAV